jgi:tetratricopeptide (TPR) repeat protein
MVAVTLDVAQWEARLAAERLDVDRWRIHVVGLVDRARTEPAREIQRDYATYVFTVGEIVAKPGILDADLMSAFFTEFGRLAANLGDPDRDRRVARALDQAITVQRQLGGEVAELYLAKAASLRSLETESEGRLNAIQAAISSSLPGSETWAEAIVTLSAYQIEVSQYDEAIATIERLREHLPAHLFETKFRCAALVTEGTARFASFQDLGRAHELLAEACTFAPEADDQAIARWVANAHHYLARIAEVNRHYGEAVDLYLQGKSFQDLCREDIEASAFIHLRMAEPLTAAGNLLDARDHLDEAKRLVETGSNISSSSLQVQLGYATLKAATGELRDAERIARDALHSARRTSSWRAELLSLGYLLVLGIRRRRPDKILLVSFHILRTAIFGELRRNKLLKLLARIPVILPIAVRRMSYRPTSREPSRRPLQCRCPLHRRPRYRTEAEGLG